MAELNNLYGFYHQGFLKNPDALLLETEKGVRFSYEDAETLSAQLANGLSELGLQPGDRVTVQVDKSPEALWLYLACLRGGFVYHPLNTAYKSEELEFFLDNAKPSLVVCDPLSEETVLKLTNRFHIPHTKTLSSDGDGSLFNLMSSNNKFKTVAVSKDDPAALLYSSGTTGRPKGIVLSHKNLSTNAETLTKLWGFTNQDRLLHVLPIYHVHGLFVALGCVLCSGASMKWVNTFDAKSVSSFMPESTVMMGVPTHYTRLLKESSFTKKSTSNIRLFVSGSAPLLEDTFNEFKDLTGHVILERYGMSETNINSSNPLQGKRLAGTVGLSLPGVEIRITNNSNESLPINEIGNLQVKGDNVFKSYWQMPEKTAEDFTVDGFFNTGDQASIDKDGYISIIGRSKDLIITGGLNVYPKELELLVNDIEGVSESAFIGLPDEDFGESVTAILVLKENQEHSEIDIKEYLKNKIANFKVPKYVFYAEELPRNAMGKVQKNVLREEFSKKI